MGNEVSAEEKQEKKILRSPNVGEASDLYWASREGDVDAVRKMLAKTSFDDLNHLEPNGSTALHAASFSGHADVVRLLLQERGVMRHRKNRHGLTAYEEAANDEIRQLFDRPNNTRFSSDSNGDSQNIFNLSNNPSSKDGDKEADNERIKAFDDEMQVKVMRSFMSALRIIFSPRLRLMLSRTTKDSSDLDVTDKAISDLQELIDTSVTSTHPQYDKACDLLSKYTKTKNSEHLLRLYTLETPFYHDLGREDYSFLLFFCLMLNSSTWKDRSFRGRTYRGLSMTRNDLIPYESVLEKKGSIIWTRTFCSTSVDEAVARGFMPTSCHGKLSVLMIFDFPKPCDTAIGLYALSDKLPCISDFENEREVLVLPWTMFHVVKIINENQSNQYTIHLENVPPKLEIRATISAVLNGNMPNL